MASILIVDDSLIMRRNLRTILERDGHEIIAEATNGEDAIRLFDLHHPDLVTMDITMPILNGIEAVKRIITAHAEASIIVISAFDQRNMLFEAMDNGAKQYIIKPITETKLLQAVRSTIQSVSVHLEHQSSDSPSSLSMITNKSAASASYDLNQTDTISVVNQDGRFIIQFPQLLLPEHMNACRVALQGLLFIRPLLLTIDLQHSDIIPPWALQSIRDIAHRIHQADGNLQFIIKNSELRSQFIHSIPSIEHQDVHV